MRTLELASSADVGEATPLNILVVDDEAPLREMLRRYVENMHSNAPVHTWALD